MIALGPIALPGVVLAALAGWIAAQLIAHAWRRRGGSNAEPSLWWLLVAALCAGRLGYVIAWWPDYAAEPWSVLDLRDRGFQAVTTGLVLVAGALLLAWRRRTLRAPLGWSVAGGMATFGFGLLVAAELGRAMHAPLPSITLQTLDGRPAALETLRGRPLVLNLWATWCGPCRRELPMLIAAAEGHGTTRFVFADQGESGATVRAYLREAHLPERGQWLDIGRQLTRHYALQGYPVTLFFDADGTLRSIHAGALSRATLADEMRHILITPHARNRSVP